MPFKRLTSVHPAILKGTLRPRRVIGCLLLALVGSVGVRLAGTAAEGRIMAADHTQRSILAPGAHLEKLAGDFKFTEGPAFDAGGNVFFTDQPNDRILKWSTEGKL